MRKLLNKKPNKNPNILSHFIIATLTCLSIVTIIQWDRGLFKAEFHEGDIALRDIYAPYDFNIRGELNSVAMDMAKKKAQETVLPIYTYDEEIQASVITKANSVTGSLKSLKDTPDISEDDLLSKTKELAPLYNLSEALLSSIIKLKDLDRFFNYSKETIEHFMQQGVISTVYYSALKDRGAGTIRVIEKASGNEKVRFSEDLFTLEDLKEKVKALSYSVVKDKKERDVVTDFVNSILNVNLIYDKEATESEKRLKAEDVQPIYNIIEVQKNESILSKGERIGKDHIEKLKGIEQSEPSVMKAGGVFAVLILVGLFMLLTVLYLKFYEPSLAAGNKELVILSFITILILIAAKVIVISPWPSNLVPVAVGSMLIAILINSRLAIITTCFLSILIGMISGNRLDIAGMSLVGGIIGVFAMKGVRRRSQVITAGLCVGFANMSYLIGMGLIRALDFNTAITESFFGFINGLISAVIVTGVLPIFENMFKVTTDISLLELADLNHPILKEMVIKAPGTYHHSLVVGNLAEAACEAIKANPLLARVSSYFHDIGKIEKASYFSENQLSPADSAHDKLSPTMSSLIITSHVKNGVELAKKYKLNRNIMDIINQHHGTGLVFYFFKRALEKVKDEEVGEQSFRYPGPKPQTKEAACVLLADSVEAASRTLDDPTSSRIKGLVRKVINNKFIDGQLDECELTLRDLERISEVFTHILTGIFHTRVEYPEEPETK
ncbi:MAG: HDIG domain-containing protein [Candidatus Omnitrophica bacterium]|nr:HDIG domain-containing protein [Candidatus Omnitrophota bacterium]